MHYGMIFKRIYAVLLAFLLLLAMPALAVQNLTVAIKSAGTLDNYTLEASLQVDAADAGKPGVVYIAATMNGWLHFRDASRNWQTWGGGKIPVYFEGVLGTHMLPLLENADARQLEGAEFHVAYGLTEADMLANGFFKRVHKVSADTVSMEGNVYIEGTTTPIVGAVISTSLDTQTATTDAAGNFKLSSKSPVSGGSAVYTVNIKANGYQPFSKSFAWGDHPAGQKFYLKPTPAVNANPLGGVWRQTAVSDPSKLTGQVIAFIEGGVMSSDDPNCTYLGSYAVSGEHIAMVPAASLVGAASCPPAGTTLLGKFTLSVDTLTIVAENSGVTYTYTRLLNNISKTGTWVIIFTTEINAPPGSITFDAAGNVVESLGQCLWRSAMTMAPLLANSLVLQWNIVEGDNNGLCGTNHFPGKKETGFAVIAGNIMYMWTDNSMRVFRKKL